MKIKVTPSERLLDPDNPYGPESQKPPTQVQQNQNLVLDSGGSDLSSWDLFNKTLLLPNINEENPLCIKLVL